MSKVKYAVGYNIAIYFILLQFNLIKNAYICSAASKITIIENIKYNEVLIN